MTSSPLGDPAGSGALVAAAQWIAGTLTGTVAVATATLAVAAVGFLMLGGRISWRRGITVIVGCFVLFGAPSIAAGLLALRGYGTDPGDVLPNVVVAPAMPTVPVPAQPQVYDPYAGASVPVR